MTAVGDPMQVVPAAPPMTARNSRDEQGVAGRRAGAIALVGGIEHTPGCEAIDREVLATCAVADPLVAVLPLASSRRTRGRTADLAVAWWTALGARVEVLREAGSHALLDAADVVVMTGGVPDRLDRRLRGDDLGPRIVAAWRRGAAVVGSSSGAMVMAGWRQQVWPPFGVVPGLGLVPDVAIAPHHDVAAPRGVAFVRGRTHPRIPIIGLDESTGIVGRGGRYRVSGVGRVTVRFGASVHVVESGAAVDLAALGVPGQVQAASQAPLAA